MKIILSILFLQLVCVGLYSQSKTIKGKILISEPSYEKGVDSDFHTLPQATIFSLDTIKLATTNEDGFFKVQVDDSTEAFMAGFIAYDFELIEISDSCEFYEIILLPDVIYDFVSPKKAARLRRKDRKIIPELYRQAFREGLIEQVKPCR